MHGCETSVSRLGGGCPFWHIHHAWLYVTGVPRQGAIVPAALKNCLTYLQYFISLIINYTERNCPVAWTRHHASIQFLNPNHPVNPSSLTLISSYLYSEWLNFFSKPYPVILTQQYVVCCKHCMIIIIMCSAQGQVLHCKLRQQDCNSAQRQDFHCKLRNLGFSFTRDE